MPTLNERHKDFFDSVYQIVRLIPEGRATSYGAIAKFLGAARSARVVGWAMNASFTQEEAVPAHRVVNRAGVLSGKNHFSTPHLMQELLEAEGIEVEDDRIKNFKHIFWDPSQELDW